MSFSKEETQKIYDLITDGQWGFSVLSYSGRGMYGKECIGIVTSRPFDIIEAIDYNSDNKEDVELLCRFLKGCITDSMGRDLVVYNPSTKWNDETMQISSY